MSTDKDFHIALSQRNVESLCEIWRYPGPVSTDSIDGINISYCKDYLLTGLTLDTSTGEMCADARGLYERLLPIIKQCDYPYIVKAWNFVPGINQGDGDQETYRQFCKGRAEAFDSAEFSTEHMPAGTGVGAPVNQGLGVFILASPEKSESIENPRQVSAYRYPRQYGPRSPSFSRGAVVHNGSGAQLYVPGTASIVGHQSQHEGNVDAQTKEMLGNVRALVSAAGMDSVLTDDKNDNAAVFRLYLRDPAYSSTVLNHIKDILPSSTRLVILDADICRRELLVEIDGILTHSQIT
ncbi:MAG: hypothetical protein OER96_05645 [Gammaproteobacteria bacterium]|nr:hypothetical protein [Gammaproteobacteria bacterium]